MKKSRLILLIILIISYSFNCFALSDVIWNGDGDGVTFNDGDNWDTDAVPGSGDSAIIKPTADITIVLNADVTVGALYIEANGSNDDIRLDVVNYVLTVEGDLETNSAGNPSTYCVLDCGGAPGGVIVKRNLFIDKDQGRICLYAADDVDPGFLDLRGNATFGNNTFVEFTDYGKTPDIIFDGTGTQTITSNTTAILAGTDITFGSTNNPTVNFIVATPFSWFMAPYDGDIVINGTTTVDINDARVDRGVIDAGGTLTINNGASLSIGGTTYNIPDNINTYTFGATSTVIFDGSGAQDISLEVSGSPYGHLQVQGSGTKIMTLTIQVAGDFTMSGTPTLDIGDVVANFDGDVNIGSGTTFLSGTATHTVTGDWDMDGTFTHEAGKISFDGSVSQNILGDNLTTFSDFHINNAAGIIITKGPTVEDVIEFQSGDITAASNTEPITLGTAATIDGTYPADDASHVNGYVAINTNATTERELPTGNGTTYRQMYIQPDGTGASTFYAKYLSATHPDTDHDGSINNISHIEYWEVDQTAGTVNAQIKLTWNASSGVQNVSTMKVAQYGGTNWASSGAATNTGTAGSGDTKTDVAVTSASFDAAKPFTIASSAANNTLPVDLIQFDATCQQEDYHINWVTASEMNNDYFQLEISPDGVSFNTFQELIGAGNSTEFNDYSVIVPNQSNTEMFFRLTQYDYDGEQTVFQTISLSCLSESKNENNFNVISNKLAGYLVIKSSIKGGGFYQINITDSNGKRIYFGEHFSTEDQINDQVFINSRSTGIYFVTIIQQGTSQTEKFIWQ